MTTTTANSKMLFTVTGYKMVKNTDTWEMEKTGNLVSVSVFCDEYCIEKIEGEVSIKMGFDWFESVTICRL